MIEIGGKVEGSHIIRTRLLIERRCLVFEAGVPLMKPKIHHPISYPVKKKKCCPSRVAGCLTEKKNMYVVEEKKKRCGQLQSSDIAPGRILDTEPKTSTVGRL